MDEVDRRRIRYNLVELVSKTHYDALIDSIARIDKGVIVPSSLMSKWKNRRRYGYTSKQMNSEFYDEIQRRGPEAFHLLIKSLESSGHQNLLEILDPTLRINESESPEVLPQSYFSEEGTHYVYFDDSWLGEACFHDREALRLFFQDQGYTGLQEWKEIEDCGDDVGSLIVVNFCSLSNGGAVGESDWLYNKFNMLGLETKPKILLSLRYVGENLKKKVQQDSGKIQKLFRNSLQVKISVDTTKKKEGEKSEEVKHLIKVFSEDNSLHFQEKVRKLQGEFKKHQMHPLEMQDSYFSRAFTFKKC